MTDKVAKPVDIRPQHKRGEELPRTPTCTYAAAGNHPREIDKTPLQGVQTRFAVRRKERQSNKCTTDVATEVGGNLVRREVDRCAWPAK